MNNYNIFIICNDFKCDVLFLFISNNVTINIFLIYKLGVFTMRLWDPLRMLHTIYIL